MTSPTVPSVDLLYLTFNCAKSLLDIPVFSAHLQTAFHQNATDLPQVVVLSLQEVAPLAYSFIGGYFLNSYISRYEQAINIAAQHVLDNITSRESDTITITPTTRPAKPYTLVRGNNVGYTAILLFARDPSKLKRYPRGGGRFRCSRDGKQGCCRLAHAL
ncbi:hypothetical protein SNK04_005121 [Fusarium graminearum]